MTDRGGTLLQLVTGTAEFSEDRLASCGKCAMQWMEGDGVHRVGSVNPALYSSVAFEGELLGLHGNIHVGQLGYQP